MRHLRAQSKQGIRSNTGFGGPGAAISLQESWLPHPNLNVRVCSARSGRRYSGLERLGYVHDKRSQRAARSRGEEPGQLLPAVHQVASLAKRWLLGTHQGSAEDAHLASYLNEFVFRFNRRRSRSRGMVFFRCLSSPSPTTQCATTTSSPTVARGQFPQHHRECLGIRRAWSAHQRIARGEQRATSSPVKWIPQNAKLFCASGELVHHTGALQVVGPAPRCRALAIRCWAIAASAGPWPRPGGGGGRRSAHSARHQVTRTIAPAPVAGSDESVRARHLAVLRSAGNTFSTAQQPQVDTEGGRQRRRTSSVRNPWFGDARRLRWHRPTGLQAAAFPCVVVAKSRTRPFFNNFAIRAIFV